MTHVDAYMTHVDIYDSTAHAVMVMVRAHVDEAGD